MDNEEKNENIQLKVDLGKNYSNFHNYRTLEENINISKNNSLAMSSNLIKEKKTKMKNNIKKINTNPFLSDVSFPNFSKKKKKFKVLPTSFYCINIKKEKIEIKDDNLGKSIFSKISEAILQNDKINEKYPNKTTINLEQLNEDNYNRLTEELYLHSKTNIPYNENKKIISKFLKRKKKEEISKKIGIENDSSNLLEALKDLKRSYLTDRNRSFKSSRTFLEFLQDQKNKEEKHQFILKRNEILQKEKINLNIRDRPLLNEESIKIMNKNNGKNKTNIHIRLYQEFNEKKKRDEEMEKERLINNKNKEKKITQKKIEENSNRLFNEYKIKRNRNQESEIKRLNEIKNYTLNSSVSNNSNEIIFKKLKKKIEKSFNNLFEKTIEDIFEISFFDFLKLLYNIGFISKKYYELIEDKNPKKNNDENDDLPFHKKFVSSKEFLNNNIKNKGNEISKFKNNTSLKLKNKTENSLLKPIDKKNSFFESDTEYKLSKEAWKIINKSKDFNKEILGNSKQIYFFFLNVISSYDGNDIGNKYIKKVYSKFINEFNSNDSNLFNKIYKYFHIFRNNAIYTLLLRDENNKKYENERNLYQNKNEYFKINNHNKKVHLSVEKNYDKYLINKNNRIKEIKKLINEKDKKIYTFIPSITQSYEKVNNNKNSTKLFNRSYKRIITDTNQRNDLGNNSINKTFNTNNNLRKMFLNNPLEKDDDIQKKVKELKQARNQRNLSKIIKEKGITMNNIMNLNNYNIYEYKERFVHTNEHSNIYKNTFKKYEKPFIKQNLLNTQKYIFEIFIENEPKKLVVNQNDDINIQIKEFCSKYKLDNNEKKQIIEIINKKIKK